MLNMPLRPEERRRSGNQGQDAVALWVGIQSRRWWRTRDWGSLRSWLSALLCIDWGGHGRRGKSRCWWQQRELSAPQGCGLRCSERVRGDWEVSVLAARRTEFGWSEKTRCLVLTSTLLSSSEFAHLVLSIPQFLALDHTPSLIIRQDPETRHFSFSLLELYPVTPSKAFTLLWIPMTDHQEVVWLPSPAPALYGCASQALELMEAVWEVPSFPLLGRDSLSLHPALFLVVWVHRESFQ